MGDGALIPCGPDIPLMLARLWVHRTWASLPRRWLDAQRVGDIEAMKLAELEVVAMASSDASLDCLPRPVLTQVIASALRLCREARARATQGAASGS
jgi:hypothetical protein